MRKVTLGKSGLEVSAVGFGGIPIQRVSAAEAERAIHAALDAGVTFFDTAAGYGDSQTKIGAAIKGRRDQLVLASKSGQRTRDGFLADVERSRRELGADAIDLYQLHGVNSPQTWDQVRAPGGALAGLVEAREKGWVGHVGFSGHSLDLAIRLVGQEDVFETVQFPFNLVTAEPADELIPLARRRNVGFIAMKPLCGGQYDDAELAFRFLNAYPDLVPIPGIERAEEIEQIAGIVAAGRTLSGDARARADAIAAELGKRFCRRCGYCEPCPQGVPIRLAMVFDSFVKRFPPDKLASGPARAVADGAPKCVECGQCETKCPYDLPIVETVQAALAKARAAIAACGRR